MAKFDRSAYKGTSLKNIKEQNESMSSQSNRGNDREYIKIEEGSNKIRIFPCHPNTDENNLYAQLKVSSWLPYMKKDRDGNLTDEVGKRPFLNAKVHANQSRDIIEEFINVAANELPKNESLSATERNDKINIIGDFRTGIKHQHKWVSYAKKGDVRGLWEFSNAMKGKMDDISLAEEEEDPTADDVISDPLSGYMLVVKYDKKKDNNKKYSVQLGRTPSEISDEDLEWHFEQDSLKHILFDSVKYTTATLDRALESLKFYDEENELGVYDLDEFQSIAKEIRASLPEPEKTDSSESSDSNEDKKLGEMSRDELKQFIMDEELSIKVLRKDSIEDILDKIEDELGLSPNDYPNSEPSQDNLDDKEEEDVFEEEEEEEEEETPARVSRRSRRTRG